MRGLLGSIVIGSMLACPRGYGAVGKSEPVLRASRSEEASLLRSARRDASQDNGYRVGIVLAQPVNLRPVLQNKVRSVREAAGSNGGFQSIDYI